MEYDVLNIHLRCIMVVYNCSVEYMNKDFFFPKLKAKNYFNYYLFLMRS